MKYPTPTGVGVFATPKSDMLIRQFRPRAIKLSPMNERAE